MSLNLAQLNSTQLNSTHLSYDSTTHLVLSTASVRGDQACLDLCLAPALNCDDVTMHRYFVHAICNLWPSCDRTYFLCPHSLCPSSIFNSHSSLGGADESAGSYGKRSSCAFAQSETHSNLFLKQIPASKFQIPNSKFQVLGSRFQVPGSRFQFLGSKFQVPDSRFQILGSRF
jgi:hypothetical protein